MHAKNGEVEVWESHSKNKRGMFDVNGEEKSSMETDYFYKDNNLFMKRAPKA